MPTNRVSLVSEPAANRRRKPHVKSRGGCGNCKLRRVKVCKRVLSPLPGRSSTEHSLQCDESKPMCNKCTAYNVSCSYGIGLADLQLSAGGALNVVILPQCLNQVVPNVIAPSLRKQGEQSLQLFNKFYSRTVFTITTDKNLHLFQDELIKLAGLVCSLTPVTQTLLY